MKKFFTLLAVASVMGAANAASVLVDDVTKIRLQNENREDVALSEQVTEIPAGYYMISASQNMGNYMLAQVKLDNQVVNPMNGASYWMVELTETSNLVITANYEEEDYAITFNDAAAIKSVTCNNQELAIAEAEGHFFTAAPAGYYVQVALNEGYTSTSVLGFYATDNHEIVTVAPALATVNIDNAAKVKLMNENRETLNVVNGAQKLSAGYYMISPSETVGNYKLAQVKLNGTVANPQYGTSYMVELAANDVLDITADYEEEDYAITFNDAAAIKSVTCNNQELAIAEAEGHIFTAAPAGYYVQVALNEGYTSTSVLGFYATEDHEIVTVAPALATVNIDNAAKVKIINENYESYNLVNGAQQFSAGYYMISPSETVGNYKLAQVKLNGTVANPQYGTSYMVELAANDVLDITADYEEEDYAITFNDAAAIKSVTCNNQELAIAEAEGHIFTAAPAGYYVEVSLNDGYTSESVLKFYATDNHEIVTVAPAAPTATFAAKVLKSLTIGTYTYTNWSQVAYNEGADYMDTQVEIYEGGRVVVKDWTGSNDALDITYAENGYVTSIVGEAYYYGSPWINTNANIDNYGGCYLYYDGYSTVEVGENSGLILISCYSYDGEAGGYPYIIVKWEEAAPEPVASCDLTAEMFYEWTAAVDGEIKGNGYGVYEVGTSTGLVYGNGNVAETLYADVAAWAQLAITYTEGTPRPLFNRDVANGQAPDHLIDIPNNADQTAKYVTTTSDEEGNDVMLVNLAQIKADYGYVHLHAIKGAYWANVTITKLQLKSAADAITGIEAINAMSNETIIDLQGRKVSEMKAGQIYLMGGKKMMVK